MKRQTRVSGPGMDSLGRLHYEGNIDIINNENNNNLLLFQKIDNFIIFATSVSVS